MKSTGIAYSNIAFIKYWGKSDWELRLPLNGSISMNLSNLKTTTTVEFSQEYNRDDILVDGQKNPKVSERMITHLNRIKKLGKSSLFAKVISQNNFPANTGLSSSASGFAALTLAVSSALNLNLKEKELSILARLGSGSACRSIPGGFVEWLKGEGSDSSYAYSIFPENHWDLVDVVAVVSAEKKQTPTSLAQKSVLTSPFISARLEGISEKIKLAKDYIGSKDFSAFGELLESECLEFHSLVMTQRPSDIYLYPGSISLMHEVRNWRREGLEVYFTVNTGHNVHLICRRVDESKLLIRLDSLEILKKYIINYPAGPAFIAEDHLF